MLLRANAKGWVPRHPVHAKDGSVKLLCGKVEPGDVFELDIAETPKWCTRLAPDGVPENAAPASPGQGSLGPGTMNAVPVLVEDNREERFELQPDGTFKKVFVEPAAPPRPRPTGGKQPLSKKPAVEQNTPEQAIPPTD